MRTLIPVISIVISLIVFFAFVKPLFSEVRIIQDETKRVEEHLSKKTDLTNELESLLSAKRSHAVTSIERLEVMVPEDIDEVKIIADLSALAKKHRMSFGSINVQIGGEVEEGVEGVAANGTGLVSSDISFELAGTYDQFKSMLRDIEHSLVLLDVLEISFSAGEGSLVQYSVKVRTYAMPKVTS